MAIKKSQKINPIWYVLPVIEIVGFFTPASWVGPLGSVLLALVVFATSIASIVGFFFLRKKSMSLALVNLIVGAIVLVLFVIFFLIGLVGGITAAT